MTMPTLEELFPLSYTPDPEDLREQVELAEQAVADAQAEMRHHFNELQRWQDERTRCYRLLIELRLRLKAVEAKR